jgi:hypothetical protein
VATIKKSTTKFLPITLLPHEPNDLDRRMTIHSDLVLTVEPATSHEGRFGKNWPDWHDNSPGNYTVLFELDGVRQRGVTWGDDLLAASIALPDADRTPNSRARPRVRNPNPLPLFGRD